MMMLTRKQILEIVEAMPDENFINIETFLNELLVFEKIERGLNDIRKGNVFSVEEVNREMNSW